MRLDRVIVILQHALAQVAAERDAAMADCATMGELCIGLLEILDRAVDMLKDAGVEQSQLDDLRCLLEEFGERRRSAA